MIALATMSGLTVLPDPGLPGAVFCLCLAMAAADLPLAPAVLVLAPATPAPAATMGLLELLYLGLSKAHSIS